MRRRAWVETLAATATLGRSALIACLDPMEVPFVRGVGSPRVICPVGERLIEGVAGGGVVDRPADRWADATPLSESVLFLATRTAVRSASFDGLCTSLRRRPDLVIGGAAEPPERSFYAVKALLQAARRGRFLRDVTFGAGCAHAWFDPLSCLRDLAEAERMCVLADGCLRLSRWRPVRLRLPTLGQPELHVTVLLTDGDQGVWPEVEVVGSTGRNVIETRQHQGDRVLDIRIGKTDAPVVDLVISGHGPVVSGAAVALPLSPSEDALPAPSGLSAQGMGVVADGV